MVQPVFFRSSALPRAPSWFQQATFFEGWAQTSCLGTGPAFSSRLLSVCFSWWLWLLLLLGISLSGPPFTRGPPCSGHSCCSCLKKSD